MDTRREQRRRIAIALLLGHVCFCVSTVDVARAKERPRHRRELGAQWTSRDVGDDQGASGRIGAVVLQKFIAAFPLQPGCGRHSFACDVTANGRGAAMNRKDALAWKALAPRRREHFYAIRDRIDPVMRALRLSASVRKGADVHSSASRRWRSVAIWAGYVISKIVRAGEMNPPPTIAPKTLPRRSGVRARRRRRAGGARKTRAPSGDSDGPASSCSPSSAGGAR
jgi:hypothetical protein